MENNFNYGSYRYIAMLDFNTAEKFVSVEPRVSVQYMQQAIEKILKHYLHKQTSNKEILHSNNLVLLGNKFNLPDLKPYRGTLAILSQYYFDDRYPGIDYIEPTLEDTEKLLGDVRQIFKIVLSAIENYQPSVSSINLSPAESSEMFLKVFKEK